MAARAPQTMAADVPRYLRARYKGVSTEREGWMISHRIARSLRLWSAKPLGGAAKSSSREATRERSTSALSLNAKGSYRVVSRGGILSRESWANFAIRVDIRDSF